MVGVGLDELFGPSRKHVHERREWVAIAKVDDRISGDDPIVNLRSGVVTVRARQADAGHPDAEPDRTADPAILDTPADSPS
jgi:hypothetical protein